jgi:hypothetical protein
LRRERLALFPPRAPRAHRRGRQPPAPWHRRAIDLFPHSAYVSAASNQPERGARLPISAAESISPAFERAKQMLFRPFRFGLWARLALVGFLAGEMSSGGCNFSSPFPGQTGGSSPSLGTGLPPLIANHIAMIAVLAGIAVVLAIGLSVIFLYVFSVMRFILFDSVVTGECHVRKNWVQRRPQGRRLFRWQVLFMLITWAAILVVVGVPLGIAWAAGWFHNPGTHVIPLVVSGVVLFFVFLALVLVSAIVQVLTKDFVVPQMALEEVSTMEAWRRLWPLLKADKGGYAGYLGMKIVLTMAAGIIFGIITLIAMIVALIPVGGVGVVAVLAGKAAGLTWNFYTIALIVIAACIALVAMLFLAALISVPTIVFFPAYSIYFFAARYEPLAALLWPSAADATSTHTP